MTLNRTYLRQLRAYRRLARFADRHSTALDVLTCIEATAFILYVFWYC